MSENEKPEIVINKEELKNYINNLKGTTQDKKEIPFYIYTIIPFLLLFITTIAIIAIISFTILSIIWLFTGGILSALYMLLLLIIKGKNNDE